MNITFFPSPQNFWDKDLPIPSLPPITIWQRGLFISAFTTHPLVADSTNPGRVKVQRNVYSKSDSSRERYT
ncbi:hypothetical protein, partial [Polaromonas sp. P5_E6]